MTALMRLRIAFLAILSLTAPSLAAAGETASVSSCIWCHGTSGRGFASAPRLAGQKPQYTENQILSFRTHTRDNPFSKHYMWVAVENLSPGTARDLATYFSTLPAKPANDGDAEIATAGRMIYREGIPDSNVVSCVACHGPSGEGIRQIPRLGGLSYTYLKRRLEQWGEGYHATAEAPMPRIAGKLSPHDIEALASYLSFVR